MNTDVRVQRVNPGGELYVAYMLRSLLRQLCSGDTFSSPQETAADGINRCFLYGGFITGQFTGTVTAKVLQTIDIKLRTIQQTHPYSFP